MLGSAIGSIVLRLNEPKVEAAMQFNGIIFRIDQALTSQGVAPASEIIEREPAGSVSVVLRRGNGHLLRSRVGFDLIAR